MNHFPVDSASFGSSYFNSIIARIVNNVQVKIKNVHLRYEDKQTVPSVRPKFSSKDKTLNIWSSIRLRPG